MPVKPKFDADSLRGSRIHHVITVSRGGNTISGIAGQCLHHRKAHDADNHGDDKCLQPPLCEDFKKGLEQCYSAQDNLLRL